MKACCSILFSVSKFGAEQDEIKITNTKYGVAANSLEVL
jgi:hypothetical protein